MTCTVDSNLAALLPVGDWRILYQPEDETITVIVLKVGRIP